MKKGNAKRIKCVTYGGKPGWFLRKHFSWITSNLYLTWQYHARKKLSEQYISFFRTEFDRGRVPLPCLVSIETINRCNSTCSFCPANRNSETRPYKKMGEHLFHKIIAELKSLDYTGYLNLYVNNEPFIDNRIEDWYLYAKEQLPDANMLLYTNGTLLTTDRFKKVIPVIDKCFINNYSETLNLHRPVKDILDLVSENPEYWDRDITVQVRYIREILTNRAGSAPNKRKKTSRNRICIMPFTDMTIYPDGTVGLCCSDALEKTDYGNVTEQSLMEIWCSPQYQNLRELIGRNRESYPFCAGCDFVDAGIRNEFMKNRLGNHKPDLPGGL